MQFQVYSAQLEDRLPRGYNPEESEREDLFSDDFVEAVPSLPVTNLPEGCVGIVFGRTEEGQSVCVRVTGVRPKLYVAMRDDDTPEAIRAEMAGEVNTVMGGSGGRVRVKEGTYCHFYGYEPDDAAPSKRALHRYAEVSYPTLRAYRTACKIRRDAELPKLQREVTLAEAHLAALEEFMETPVSDDDAAKLKQARKELDKLQKRFESRRAMWADVCPVGADLPHVPSSVLDCRAVEESFVDPLTRFLYEQDLTPSRWYSLVGAEEVEDVVISTCNLELQVDASNDAKVFRLIEDRLIDAPYVTLNYDIETMGLDPETTQCIQVGLVFVCKGVRTRHLVALDTVAPIPEVNVHSCRTEAELLRTTRRIIVEHDPDFAVAYNGINFDNNFLAVRAKKLGSTVDVFWYLSRFAFRPAKLRELKLNSSGMGDNLLKYFEMPGRSNFDWYIKLKRDLTSEPSYKLDHMGRTIVGEQKHEIADGRLWRRVTTAKTAAKTTNGDTTEDNTEGCLDHRAPALATALRAGQLSFTSQEWEGFGVDDINANHWVSLGEGADPSKKTVTVLRPTNVGYRAIAPLQAGTPRDRARLGAYCVQDCNLLELLNEARTMITEILQFCGVFYVVPEWINFRGQQVRYVAQLLRKVRTVEAVPMIMQRPPEGWDGEGVSGYEGATVNEPEKGFHKKPVVVLDWKSLYPAVMISFNLCYSTLCKNPTLWGKEGVVEHKVSEDYVVHFTTKHEGILPRILEELLSERDRVKKQVKMHLKASKDSTKTKEETARSLALAQVCDGRQLALKVGCNSVYGATGAVENGKLPCLAISAATTFRGRDAMVIKKEILPLKFPSVRVVYGDTDSVFLIFEDCKTVQEAGEVAVEAADYVTHHFQKVLKLKKMELEFEKIYLPMLLQGKKRYEALKWEMDGNGIMVCKGMDAKGVETERKDTLPFLKEIKIEVRGALMNDIDEHKALRCFEEKMELLLRNEVPMEKLTMRKNLSGKVANKTDSIAQARVNALRREREPGSEAAVNEQVEYVLIAGHKNEKTTQLAEDPAYAREHGLKLNNLWYFEHAIEEPMRKVFECFDNIDFKRVCDGFRAKLNGARLGVNTSMMKSILKRSSSASSSSLEASSSSMKAYIPKAPPPPPRKKPKVGTKK